ncbi:MAG: hypothetical protein LBU05_07145 [Bifidobacteriaceae bacterium]|nr:hypothetical protein [Bifidobacteriaceae bacterium]
MAERHWPAEPRSRLVVRLMEAGAASLERDVDRRREAHEQAIEAHAGQFSDLYPPGYLAELREDWPA